MRASWMSVAHSARASAWSVPARFAIRRIDGTDTPSACDTSIPDAGHPRQAGGVGGRLQRGHGLVYVTSWPCRKASGPIPCEDGAMRPLVDGTKLARAALIGDVIALLVFLVFGVSSHKEEAVGRFLALAVIFVGAWVGTAWAIGTYRPVSNGRLAMNLAIVDPDRRAPPGRRRRVADRGRDPHLRRGRAALRVDLRRDRPGGRGCDLQTPGGEVVIDLPRPGAARSFWLQEALAHDRASPRPRSRRTSPPTSASSAAGSRVCGPRSG